MNYRVQWLRGVAVGVVGLSLVGCASTVPSGNRPVTINSDAQVTPPAVNVPPPAVSEPVGPTEVVTPAVQAPQSPGSDDTNAPAQPAPAVPSSP